MVTAEREFRRMQSTPDRLALSQWERESQLADQLHDLIRLPDAALEHAMAERLRREDALQPEERHNATLDRLRAWLALGADDARIVSRFFERAAASLGPDVQARRVETEWAVISNALSFEEFRALAPLLGWLTQPPFDTNAVLEATDSGSDAALVEAGE